MTMMPAPKRHSHKKPIAHSRHAKPHQQALEHTVEVKYSGPLPDPMTFSAYEKITPGAGERIIAMAEKEQEHRHAMKAEINAAIVQDAKDERLEIRRGQWLAWSLALVILCIGGSLLYTDHPITGSLLTGTTLIAIIGAFLNKNKKIQQKAKGAFQELAEKE